MQDKEVIILALRHVAKQELAIGHLSEAERIYKALLSKAECSHGKNSLLVGLALIDLAECWEKQGKIADKLHKRIRKILATYAKKPSLRANK